MVKQLFPEEITDADLAYSVGKLTWKKLVKVAHDSTEARVKDVKVRLLPNNQFRHKYIFNDVAPPQLVGMFASSLEDINSRKIVTFEPKNNSVVIIFSSESLDESED